MDLLTLAMAKNYTDQKQKETSATVPTKTSQLENDSCFKTENDIFYAEYEVTTIEEMCEAYRAGKKLICVIDKGGATEKHADLTYINGVNAIINNNANTGIFVFSHVNNSVYTRYYYQDGWNTDSFGIVSNITYNHNEIVKSNTHINANAANIAQNASDILKITTNYKYEDISVNGKFQLREKGFYIFGGYDYDLNLCDASGNTIGKTSLIIIVFCTEADINGNFRVYVMQNYKNSLGISSIDGMPYANFTKDYYVHNTNTSEKAYVYYMRQNVV